MNDVVKNIMSCRSVRNYTAQKVSKDILDELLSVGKQTTNTDCGVAR